MKKRLRKKLRKDEFTEFGFQISINFNDRIENDKFDYWWNEFIDLIEENNLAFGGGGDYKNYSGFITSFSKKGSATNEDRNTVKNWLRKQKDVDNFIVEELTDCWK